MEINKDFVFRSRRSSDSGFSRLGRGAADSRVAVPKVMLWVDALAKFNWLYNLIIAAGLASLGVGYLTRPGAPVKALGVSVITPDVTPGAPVSLVYRMDRDRTCPATIAGFWVDVKGEAVARLSPVPGGYGVVGNNVRTPVTVYAPQAPPGRYAYRSNMFSMCETGMFVMVSPDAWINVRGP